MLLQEDNLTEFEWALYGGNWGAPLQMPSMTLWCLDNPQQTVLSECPNNSTGVKGILLASKLLSIPAIVEGNEQRTSNIDGTDQVYTASYVYVDTDESTIQDPVNKVLLGGPYSVRLPSNSSTVGFPSHPGVLTRGFSYLWVSPGSPSCCILKGFRLFIFLNG